MRCRGEAVTIDRTAPDCRLAWYEFKWDLARFDCMRCIDARTAVPRRQVFRKVIISLAAGHPHYTSHIIEVYVTHLQYALK